MRWLAKSAVQNVISVLPGSVAVNGVLQRYGTGSVVMTPERVVSRLVRIGGRHVEHQRRFGTRPLDQTTVVEVGTRFVPLLPVGLYLAGAAAVHTYDIAALKIAAHGGSAPADRRRRRSGAIERVPGAAGPARHVRAIAADPPIDLDVLLAAMHITYHVGDATRSGLDAGSAHLFVTNNVFEHVPADVTAPSCRGAPHRPPAALRATTSTCVTTTPSSTAR